MFLLNQLINHEVQTQMPMKEFTSRVISIYHDIELGMDGG